MPPHTKLRQLKCPKRPKCVSKRTAQRRPHDKKFSPSKYDKMKTNNRNLAHALNKQKEETELLTRENLALSRRLQESTYLNTRHTQAFFAIRNNCREGLDLLVKLGNMFAFTVSQCNTFLQSDTGTSVPSASAESTHRASTKSPNKSPARGVVQPMVSGHAIAQPAIALSRLRIARLPNVSDIEETSETSPPSVRLPTQRIANRTIRPVNRLAPLLPERIRLSTVGVDEPEDRRSSSISNTSNVSNTSDVSNSANVSNTSNASNSANSSNTENISNVSNVSNNLNVSTVSSRRSSRPPKRKSRTSGRLSVALEPPRSSITIVTSIRSPRVSLEDVSRLLHNSHSINVRTLMDSNVEEASATIEDAGTLAPHNDEVSGVTPGTPVTSGTSSSASSPGSSGVSRSSDVKLHSESPITSPTSSPLSQTSSPTFQSDHRGIKRRKLRRAAKAKEAAKVEQPMKKCSFLDKSDRSQEDDPLEGPSWRYSNDLVTSGVRDSRTPNGNDKTNRTLENSDSQMEVTRLNGSFRDSTGSNRMSLTMINPHNGWDDDEDDDDRCQRIDVQRTRNGDEETSNFTAVFSRNVCTSRGRLADLDPDDFTMMQRPPKPFKPWTMDDLEMPDIPPQQLEAPLVRPAEIMAEPEITKTLQIMAGLAQQMNLAGGGEGLPNVTINTSVAMPVVDAVGRESEDDTTIIASRGRHRMAIPIAESSSDSESSTPPKRSAKGRGKGKRKDPKEAKVVLEKLKEPADERAGSPHPRRSTLNGIAHRTLNSLTSDSESSNASFGSNGRPRRNRAPVSFAEPSLRKKLRRG